MGEGVVSVKTLSKLMHMLGMFSCIYGCGFSGTYEEVQAHQAAAHGYGK